MGKMKGSLGSKITTIFIIVSFLVCVLFVTFSKIQTNKELNQMQTAQLNSINYLIELYNKGTPPSDIQSYFKTFNLQIVKDKNLISKVSKNGNTLFSQNTFLGNFSSIEYKHSLYMRIKNEAFCVFFRSTETKKLDDLLLIGFFVTIVLLACMYYSMMRSLSPLKELSNNMQEFAKGNIQKLKIDASQDNEIAKVAKEFNNATQKIQELLTSRQLFLRTIMHELKTPIGKGRIVAEMLDDELSKQRLVNVFERLEILINEFAKVEQLLSKNYTLNYQEYHFSIILEQVKDILMLDNWEKRVNVDFVDDAVIRIDFQLFSLMFKNLIDNALKYAADGVVTIRCEKNRVCILNKAKGKAIPIDYYKQAFIRNQNEKTKGMGLGLYIIDKICQMHNFKLEYSFNNDKHCFFIFFDEEYTNEINAHERTY